MGFRFSIEHANWLAHILQPAGATPQLDDEYQQLETLRSFVESFYENFYTSRRADYDLRELLERRRGQSLSLRSALAGLQDLFRDTPWFALLLPGASNSSVDEHLTSKSLLRNLVTIRPDDPGLILQLQEPPRDAFALKDVFPAFKIALASISRWPGVLVWTRSNDAAFFELPVEIPAADDRLYWLFSHLGTTAGIPDLELLKRQFSRSLPSSGGRETLRLLHLSDLHLGSQVARRRLARTQMIIELVIRELGEDHPIVPVITGDLMDTPSEENLGDVRSFLGYIKGLGLSEPAIVLGNHDVREDGWLDPKFEQAVNISRRPVIWLDEHEVALACFNSVNGGRLARGFIGESELSNVGNVLDSEPLKNHYFVIGLLHHHPIPVARPDWYAKSWYERILGSRFEKTDDLEDADCFLKWLTRRNVTVALHGHKHIPRFDRYGNIAVIGCGSTVGKVQTASSGETYMSLNIVEIDRSRNMLCCRLRAERIPGAGLESVATHELVLRQPLN
jgi:hypothetical protein